MFASLWALIYEWYFTNIPGGPQDLPTRGAP